MIFSVRFNRRSVHAYTGISYHNDTLNTHKLEGTVGNACERHEQHLNVRANSISPAAVLKNDVCSVLVPVFARACVLLHRKGTASRFDRQMQSRKVQDIIPHRRVNRCLHNKLLATVRLACETILNQENMMRSIESIGTVVGKLMSPRCTRIWNYISSKLWFCDGL